MTSTPPEIYFSRCSSCRLAKNRTKNPLCSGCQREGQRERGKAMRGSGRMKKASIPAPILALPPDERAAALAILRRHAPTTPHALYYAAREAVSDVRRAVECAAACCEGMSRERRLELVLE